MRFSLLLFSILIFPAIIFSQKDPIRFGKIPKTERSLKSTKLDPDANAVILCDFGEIDFTGTSVEITRHIRIKILNKKGVDEANIVLPYFYKDNIERIFKIKAQTINISNDGKLEKIKVKKDDIYTLDVSEDWKEKRFTFPNVKTGSIIEYQYSKKSESVVSLEEWTFQNSLPTLKSHLNVLVGGNLDYKIVYNGNRLINKYGNKDSNSWSLENLPPLKEEPYCPNPEDYVESIQFQLAGYQKYISGGSEYVHLMTSWEKLAKDILGHQNFKSILNRKRNANKMVLQIIDEDDEPLEKVKKIYSFVQNEIDWDGNYRLFPEEKFSMIMERKRGSSAEINLCLVRLLNSADLDANPLIISTKGNGAITKSYPLYRQFNHVLAQVKIGEKDILMDATSKFRPYNLLGKDDLKPEGFLLHNSDSRWVEIGYPLKTRTVIVNNLKFEDDKMKIKTSYAFFGHKAVEYRKKFHEERGEKSFITTFLQKPADEDEMTLDSFTVNNYYEIGKPFSVNCYYTKNSEDKLDADIIYLNPFIKKHLEKNPFVNPVRYLPVDFILPSSEKFIYNLLIPEGYVLAEIPQSIKLSTSSKKISYTFAFNQLSEKNLQLSSTYKVTTPLIYPEEYGDLRELFNKVLGFQATQLVLKRK
ncbi:MAG: DUF3857 domain-containing protein [Saprospiraceae bacterium]